MEITSLREHIRSLSRYIEMKEDAPITCCFYCGNPLVMGRIRQVWLDKAKYSWGCTDCFPNDQDSVIVKMCKEGVRITVEE
jgi:hypothetical protein